MIEIVRGRGVLSVEALYGLCNKHRWFTCGTNMQYEKMFDMLRDGSPLEEIALVIWLCSDEDVDRDEVLHELKAAVVETMESLIEEED